MKTDGPIRVDRRRRDQPPGGRWEALDFHTRGRMLVLEVPDPAHQATALVERIHRLRGLGGGAWSDFAVLAHVRALLEPICALCEVQGISVAWRGDLPPVHRVREIAGFLERLRSLGQESCMPGALQEILPAQSNPWLGVAEGLLAAWTDEEGEAALPAGRILEYCFETPAEQRRDRSVGDGVLLSTLHGAKGLGFPHVLIADGRWRGEGTCFCP